MHLQQTKAKSRVSGGPQYFFHALADHVKEFLRNRGACPVVLQTPYGIAHSAFMAVDKDHKLARDGKVVEGKVGHDRIQQAGGDQSIGEAIRYWYGIRAGRDFERIEVEVAIHPDGHFILVPTSVTLRRATRPKVLEKVIAPLSFHRDYQSKLWRQQIDLQRKKFPSDVAWAASQVRRVVSEHCAPTAKNILESDLLRTAGALSRLGLDLGPYLGTGYDCMDSTFQFLGLPMYTCPVEIKIQSKGFNYQVTQYPKLPRAVVLCMDHNFVNPPEHIDFIALPVLADCLDH
ncbi:MAG: hypothetical protein JW955_03215 [Sedimentisphaerales bacterium]|nr:hypothetical protein [Sedimentisphaerales bacterium]